VATLTINHAFFPLAEIAALKKTMQGSILRAFIWLQKQERVFSMVTI
tara:strand:- start:55 stop:195 length:141 start_codon:yes stop_codon:yes gene_type:complete